MITLIPFLDAKNADKRLLSNEFPPDSHGIQVVAAVRPRWTSLGNLAPSALDGTLIVRSSQKRSIISVLPF